MKLIINTSTLSGTGVTQVAHSVLEECKNFPENEYHIFYGPEMAKILVPKAFPDHFYFYEFKGHPLYGLAGFSIRKKMKALEKQINPDAVFTVFGPACWTPQAKHITGFANSYYVYPDSPFFSIISRRDYFRIKLLSLGHRFFLKRNGNYFICETEDMSERLSSFLKIPRKHVFTVSNTYSSAFENEAAADKVFLPSPEKNEFRFLVLSSFQIHKNLTVLNQVIPLLEKYLPDHKITFVLTIDDEELKQNFSEKARSRIANLGRVEPKDCPSLYRACDALFLPTLIEAFSANYPEAMKMQIPILTSGYSFAKSICGDAALYFDPQDPTDIARKCSELVKNQNLQEKLIKNGDRRLLTFGSATERTAAYLQIISAIVKS